jgi:glutaconate CoA-transferase subunit A
MADKRMTLDELVGELHSGMTIGIGGWGSRRKPMAAVRAILRSDLTGLTVVSYGGPDVGLLCAAGKVAKVVYGFVTLDSIPTDPHFKAARQAGAVDCMEIDEGMFYLGLLAASQRVPFLPTRAGLGSDVLRLNPSLRTVTSPYDDAEELVAMPALRLDAALVHVNRADARGSGQILGPDPFFDEVMLGAADRRLVTAERIIDTDRFASEGAPMAWRRPQEVRTSPPASPTTSATRSSSGRTWPRQATPTSGRPSPPVISRCPKRSTRPPPLRG